MGLRSAPRGEERVRRCVRRSRVRDAAGEPGLARVARGGEWVFDYVGVGCFEGPMEKSAFERAKRAGKTAFTAEYKGHALATLPVTQDARARIAHGAPRARCPKPGDRAPSEHPVTKRVDGLAAFLDCACGDSLRTFRDWPDFVLPPSSQSLGRRQIKPVPRRDGFATAMCSGPRRSLRRSRNAAIFLPTTTVTR